MEGSSRLSLPGRAWQGDPRGRVQLPEVGRVTLTGGGAIHILSVPLWCSGLTWWPRGTLGPGPDQRQRWTGQPLWKEDPPYQGWSTQVSHQGAAGELFHGHSKSALFSSIHFYLILTGSKYPSLGCRHTGTGFYPPVANRTHRDFFHRELCTVLLTPFSHTEVARL